VLSDLKYALRRLAKSPGFTAIAILIVAIGIGAATAMFSTVNALVLRPFPLPDADRIAAVYETNLPRNVPFFSASVPDFLDWQVRSHSWEALAAVRASAMNLTGGAAPEFVNVRAVTANFLPTLGLTPAIGRGFRAEEDRPGHNQVAIITAEFAERHFGRVSPAVLGQTLPLDGVNYSIIGVMAAGTRYIGELEIAIPMGADASTERRTNHELDVYGRLKRGVSLAQADAELKTIAAGISAEHPDIDRGWSVQLVPLARDLVGREVSRGLFALLGAVGLLLLIAAANFSNLLLVRASSRAHEVAIRTALGAGRWRVIRQFLTESLLVTGAGGSLGVLASWWAVGLLRSTQLPRAAEISVDFSVLAAGCCLTLLVGLLAGLGPALKGSHIRPQEALKGRAARSGHSSRLRDTMVVAQLALSLALLVGAAILVRSFSRLLHVNPGYTTEHVLTVSMHPADNRSAVPFYQRVTARIAALPDVASVGLISSLPLTDGNTSNNIFPLGPSALPVGESIQSSWRLVDGGYFETLQIPLARGRTFAGLSPDEARRSVVLSASLARGLFGDGNPLGRQIANLSVHGQPLTVIGVVGDVRSTSLGTAPAPTFYWSMHRFIYGPMRMVVRTTRDTAPLAAEIRRIVGEIDPGVPVFRVSTMDEFRGDSLSRERLVTGLLAGFAGVALLLAALGIYGVVAFTVQERSREIGIRIAVGAQTGDVLRLILGQGARLAALGTALGLVGAFAASRLLATLLYQTSTLDALSYVLATVVLVAVALLASFLPARRATKVDPIAVLRTE
jgi:putative ABC transport system permease protein